MARVEVKKANTLIGHNGSIYMLEAADNHRFLSAGADGMVVLWDLMSEEGAGEVIAKTNGTVYALGMHQESGRLFIGQNEDGIRSVHLKEKKEASTVHLGKDQIFDIRFYNDDVWVALSSGELVILDLDLHIKRRLKLSGERVRSIDFSGNVAAVSFSDHTIRILDTQTFEVVFELKGHQNSVFTSRFHPSGKYLISCGRDAHIKVWDTQENYVLRESIPAHLYTINHLVFSKDGRYFVTGSMDKAIKLWDAYNFKLLKVLDKQRHAAHGNSVNRLLWMDYRDLLVTCSDDRTISIWDLKIEE